MAYADLFADADLYIPFNNSATASINTGTVVSTTGNTPRTYSLDAPANLGTTYSLNCVPQNSGSTLTQDVDTYTLPNTTTGKQKFSISFWFKYATSNGLTSLTLQDNFHGGNILYGSSTNQIGVSALAYNNLTISGVFGDSISINDWHHIAIVSDWQDTTTTNNASQLTVYIDGNEVVGFTNDNAEFAAVDNTYTALKYLIGYNAGATGMTAQIAHYGVWNNKVLTNSEVKDLALYSQIKENFSQAVLTDELNPVTYATCEKITGRSWATDSMASIYFNTGSTFSSGLFGNAFVADSTHYGSVQFSRTTDAQSPFGRSFSFWIKLSTLNAIKSVFMKKNSSQHRYQVRIGAENTPYVLLVASDGSVGFYGDTSAGAALTTGQWYHITFTFGGSDAAGGQSGGYQRTYVNGVQTHEMLLSFNNQPSTLCNEVEGYLNRRSTGGGAFIQDGGYQMSDFVIFDYELNAAQAKQVYNSRNQIKHWDGDSWDLANDTQVSNGATWVDGLWKHWDGFQWQELNTSN